MYLCISIKIHYEVIACELQVDFFDIVIYNKISKKAGGDFLWILKN